MKGAWIPYATIIICAATLVYSMYVAFDVTGNVLGTVKIPLLEPYGGIELAHLARLEVWRLFASQLVHAKQLHMLFNVLSLALLGVFVERHARGPGFFLLWFLSGSAGTVLGTLSTAPPWHLGTGGSQAVSGIAAFGLVLHLKGVVPSKWFAAILCFTIIPAFALDFIHAGHPKPGHVVGFLVGAVAGLAFCRHGRPGTLWNGRT